MDLFFCIRTARTGIEQTSNDTCPVHCFQYPKFSTKSHFTAIKIQKKLQEDIKEPASTEWDRPIVFAPEKIAH